MVTRIAIWSGPRALSTALMRAWENRPDCIFVDEPLYGAYLSETGIDHPMRAEIIAAVDCDAASVGQAMASMVGADVIYQKHMSHHLLPSMTIDWVDSLTNAFLIRDPARVLASYDQKRPAPTLTDIGIAQQAALFERQQKRLGTAPVVVDADDLQRAPEATLRVLCQALEVPFLPQMLAWPAGPRDSDGIWAAHWYDQVWASTSFGAPWQRAVSLSPSLEALCKQAQPLYDKLAQHRLTATG
jgi:hypothetical protein